MGVTFNGSSFNSCTFNGSRVNEIQFNGSTVWTAKLDILVNGVLVNGFSETSQYTNNSVFPRCAADSGWWGYLQTTTRGTVGTHYRAGVYIPVDCTGYSTLHVKYNCNADYTNQNGGIKGDTVLLATKSLLTFSASASRIDNLTTDSRTVGWLGNLNGGLTTTTTATISGISEVRYIQLAVYAYNQTYQNFRFRVDDMWLE